MDILFTFGFVVLVAAVFIGFCYVAFLLGVSEDFAPLFSIVAFLVVCTWICIGHYAWTYEPPHKPSNINYAKMYDLSTLTINPYIYSSTPSFNISGADFHSGWAKSGDSLSFISNGKRFATIKGQGKTKHVTWTGQTNLSLYGADGVTYEIEHIPLKACRSRSSGRRPVLTGSPMYGAYLYQAGSDLVLTGETK